MNKYIKEHPDSNDLINKLGSNNKVAELCGVSAAAVSYWRENGIPELRLIQLKFLKPEAFL